MSIPPSTVFVVTNMSSSDLVINSKTVSANGGQTSYGSSDVPAVCTDLAFRIGILAGTVLVSINGIGLGGSQMLSCPQLSQLLSDIALGNVIIP